MVAVTRENGIYIYESSKEATLFTIIPYVHDSSVMSIHNKHKDVVLTMCENYLVFMESLFSVNSCDRICHIYDISNSI